MTINIIDVSWVNITKLTPDFDFNQISNDEAHKCWIEISSKVEGLPYPEIQLNNNVIRRFLWTYSSFYLIITFYDGEIYWRSLGTSSKEKYEPGRIENVIPYLELLIAASIADE